MTDGIGDFTLAGVTLIITAILWLVLDVYMYVKDKKTLSVQVYEWSKMTITIPFLLGFICGHWFW